LVTTASIQGNDADIVITSGVAENKHDVNKGLRYTARPDKIAVNTTRARYLDVYVANFGPAIEYLHAKQKVGTDMLVSTKCTMYRALVEHLHNNGSIVSAGDFGRTVLADEPDVLLKSSHQQRYEYKLEKKGSKAQPTGMGQREARNTDVASPLKDPKIGSSAKQKKKEAIKARAAAAGMSLNQYKKHRKEQAEGALKDAETENEN
jgi:hypothetical protein